MSDLFSLVKQSKLTQQTKFWGHYEYLNNPAGGDVDNETLFKMQVARLKILENNNTQLQNANKFLESMKKINPDQVSEKILELSENQIYARIMELINSGLISSELNPTNRALKRDSNGKFRGYKEGSSLETIKQEEVAIVNELTLLLNLINYANTDQLTTNLVRAFSGAHKFSNKPDGEIFSTYALYKSSEIEALMAHALMQNEGWKAIQTGAFYNKSQQLLEDVFAFDIAGLNIKFNKDLSFTIKQEENSTEIKVRSIGEFFAEYEKLSGKYSVSLSDELYEKFQQLSVLAGQAKSGKDLQALINSRAKTRNAISLNDLGPTSSLIGLYQLYQADWIDEGKESKSLITIANYCLSKSIALTNITGNQIYFTRDGFITATQWMELYRQMLKFNPSISKVSNNLLDKANPYAFCVI